MSKIIRRKSDNQVFYCIGNSETAVLSSTNFHFTLNNGARKLRADDINSDTHELLTGITPPTTFSGSGIFSYTDSGWSINTDVLEEINRCRNHAGMSDMEVAL